ncbi:MAG: S8 family peptidase [bacterium]|nr:S8 family peptidase [bacterium]
MADVNDTNRCRDAIYSEEVADYIVENLANISNLENSQNFICTQGITGKFDMVYIPITEPITTQIITNAYRNLPKLYGLMDTASLEDMGVYRLRRLPYLELYGTGTLIGVIDTGIDYTNPLFINTDNTSRIAAIWDQTVREGPAPSDLSYGTEYLKADLNRALASETPLEVVPSIDEDGHGTYISAIIGGNIDEKNDFSGVAPRAEFVVVKLKPAKQYLREFYKVSDGPIAYQDNDIMLGVEYLRRKALELGRPISICLGLGTSSGDHDGDSNISNYLNSISNQTGVCISTAAGNEGNTGHHNSGNVDIGAYKDIELKAGDKQKGLTLELWSITPTFFSVALISPSGEIAERVPARQGIDAEVTFVLEPTTIHVTYALSDTATGNELIFIQFDNLSPGIWKIRVYNDSNIGTRYDMWLPISQFVDTDTFFLEPDPFTTLVETGTTARVLSVGAYDNKGNSIYIASSRGYTLSNQIKPDLAAPGVNIFGPVSKIAFGEKSGSSIAAANAAGIGSLFLQWGIVEKKRPVMNTSEIKSLLISGADRRAREYPNQEWGYGALNAYNAFEGARKSI